MVTACATHPIPSTPPETRADWVHVGSGAYVDVHEKVFYGVGKASGIRNPMLLRSSADNQAQQEVARVVAEFISDLAHGVTNDIENEGWMHRVVHNSVADAVIIDHRQDSDNGYFYALSRLSLANVKSHLEVESALPQETRRAMLDHADEWHVRMAQH